MHRVPYVAHDGLGRSRTQCRNDRCFDAGGDLSPIWIVRWRRRPPDTSAFRLEPGTDEGRRRDSAVLYGLVSDGSKRNKSCQVNRPRPARQPPAARARRGGSPRCGPMRSRFRRPPSYSRSRSESALRGGTITPPSRRTAPPRTRRRPCGGMPRPSRADGTLSVFRHAPTNGSCGARH